MAHIPWLEEASPSTVNLLMSLNAANIVCVLFTNLNDLHHQTNLYLYNDNLKVLLKVAPLI